MNLDCRVPSQRGTSTGEAPKTAAERAAAGILRLPFDAITPARAVGVQAPYRSELPAPDPEDGFLSVFHVPLS
jgi:hypothetical protein